MTPSQFQAAWLKSRLRARAMIAARRVLVDGQRQVDVARQLGVSQAAVSKAVKVVLRARGQPREIPKSWRTITVTVPRPLAAKIRHLAKVARAGLRGL